MPWAWGLIALYLASWLYDSITSDNGIFFLVGLRGETQGYGTGITTFISSSKLYKVLQSVIMVYRTR